MSVQVVNVLERALDASALRQKTISNNLANAETPHYQSQQVVFEEVLKEAINPGTSFQGKRTDTRHIQIGSPSQLPVPQVMEKGTIHNNNGNGVDMDYEMTALSRNSLWYNALAQQINHEFNLLKTVVRGRG